mgnify:CR=1 FL=1
MVTCRSRISHRIASLDSKCSATRSQTERGSKVYPCDMRSEPSLVLLWVAILFLTFSPISTSEDMTAATDPSSTSESVIKALELDRHIEGGYFRRTFVSDYSASQEETSPGRKTMSSIYYLLNAESPVGHFHRNKSDIVHYFHMGDPIAYFLIHPDGELQEVTLGHNIEEDHKLQLVVPGGVWKASRLKANGAFGYGLISEAVSPSFNYDDMTLGSSTLLKREFPQHGDLIDKLSYPAPR